MVEINNQRKAFLDMLAWSEGTDNGRQKTRNQWLWRHCGGRAIYRLLRSPSQTCSAKPKTQIGSAGRYQLLSVGGIAYRKQFTWKTSLRKVRTLWHCSRLRSVALYLWLIVVISVSNRPLQQYLGFTAGRCCGQFEHKADSLIAKFKEAGGTVREIDVWAESPRLSPLWLSASSSARHGLLIITVITPLPTKPSATKMPENWKLANAAITDMQMRQRDVAALDAKYTKELADAKAENDALRDDVAAGRRRLHISSLSVSAWSHHAASGVDNAASPRLADTAERDYFTLRERLITMRKTTEGTQKYINEQCR